MQKKNIFKTVALAMLMPAMLLTTACSSEDDVANINNEPTVKKGYALPVTVNVTRQGDATTRATFDGSMLNFSAGDKLFVNGNDNSANGAGQFAGTLTWQSGGTFSGTIYTQNDAYSTYDALLTAASSVKATLLPNGYGSTGFISIDDKSISAEYDDDISFDVTKAFVASGTAKATGVEQLSLEQASTYDNGFELAPQCAILNFTISGLEAGAKDVTLNVTPPIGDDYTVTGSVTPNASGFATFAVGVPVGANIKDMDNNLTVGSSKFTLPSSTTFAAGKIYNIARCANPGALIGKFTISDDNGTHTRQVYFSKGNLQATTTDKGTSWTWAFAEQQWSYVGYAAPNGAIIGNKTVDTNGTVDLFGWSTADAENYLGIHKSNNDFCYSGNFVDWGLHEDVTAGIGSGWCTLSIAEWNYLFFTRRASTVGGTENGRYAKAKVNTVQGIILFPDTYTHPDGVTAPTGVNVTGATGWNGNNYSSADWTKMESAGCVFLPAAGYRDWEGVNFAGDDGYYWSSSANGDEDAHYVYFSSSDLVVDEYTTSRYNGHSVRLVRDVAAPAYTMAAAATTSDKGKLICTAGHIHVYGEDAACTAGRVAKIIYVGSTGHATYSHGLALALTDEGQMAWQAAIDACSAKNTSTPVTGAEWLLASKDQWGYMASGAGSYTALRTGFSGISGASNLQSDYYWSGTEVGSGGSGNAWCYDFDGGSWGGFDKNIDYFRVRACLAF